MKEVILESAEEVCGRMKCERGIRWETWWWSEDVQAKLKAKKQVFQT